MTTTTHHYHFPIFRMNSWTCLAYSAVSTTSKRWDSLSDFTSWMSENADKKYSDCTESVCKLVVASRGPMQGRLGTYIGERHSGVILAPEQERRHVLQLGIQHLLKLGTTSRS